MSRRASARAGVLAALAVLLALVAAGCGGGRAADDGELRLGYFANVTHAAAIVGLERGVFARDLPGVKVKGVVFLSGPEAVSALLSGSIDAAYVGAAPVITALSRARGELRTVAGANNGGALLVARTGTGIRRVADLAHRRVAVPALGNTQDLTLRELLRRAGLRATDQGGSVKLIVVKNAQLSAALANHVVDAAMTPEPWASGLVHTGEADVVLGPGRVLGGTYPTTILVVSKALAQKRPDLVARLRRANAESVALVARRPGLAAAAFQRMLQESTGKSVDPAVLAAAVRGQTATTTVDRAGMEVMVAAAARAGYLARPVALAEVMPAPQGAR